MSAFIVWFLILSVLALAAENAWVYWRTAGTPIERLAACGRGSLTIFVNVWGGIISTFIVSLDGLAGLTGYPEFATLSNSLNAVIPAQYHPLFPAVTAALAIWARSRTLKT